MEKNQVSLMEVGDWKMRIRRPPGEGPHPLLLLLHGWTGDENSMWVFSSKLPKEYLLVAPRGIFSSSMNGYSWHHDMHRHWPSLEDFEPAIDALMDLLVPSNFPDADLSTFQAAGFSQGAALTYSLALRHPERVSNFAGLAGFMPEDVDGLISERPLQGKRVYITHGTQDDLVPVEKARKAAGLLEEAGATVKYCEEDVGHKLSASCFRGMEEFFTDLANKS